MPRASFFANAAVTTTAVCLLALTGCRSNPFGGRKAEPVAKALPPAPPPPVVRMPAPMPPPVIVSSTSPATAEQLRVQQETIARQRDALEAERMTREAAEARLRAAEEALAAAKAPPQGEEAAIRVEEELRSAVVAGATVLREGSRVVVVLTDAFKPGEDALKPGADVQAAILATGTAIVRHPEAQIAVFGHSDGTPLVKSREKWGDNVGLSRARAETVAKALEGGAGVPRDRLTVDGRGAAEPLVAPERTSADRARNRRVEIQFSF